MGKQRKTWSAEVKEAIVLSVVRGETSVAEAARQHGVHESLIHTWKASFLREVVPAWPGSDRTRDTQPWSVKTTG